jgi:diacylglycerol kinase (ATP)
MKVLFIIKGNIAKYDSIILEINEIFKDINYSVKKTHHPTQATETATKLATKNTHIITVGGDGKLNEVVNGLIKANASNTLGFYPAGKDNDYSASANGPKTLKELKESITHNRITQVNSGKDNFTDIYDFQTERYFINIADIGIGGEVVQEVNNDQSRLPDNLKFFKNIIVTFFDFESHNIKTIINNLEINEKVLSLVIAKGKHFGGRIGITPYADPTKNELDIAEIGDVSALYSLKKGNPIIHKYLEYFKTTELAIETDVPSPIDMDGEFVSYTPVKFSTHNTPINFIAA